MVFSFLTKDNIFKKFDDSKSYTELLTTPFTEWERIARNRPSETVKPKYPRVTDGTTASIIRKTPRRVVQQLPTGSVESDDEEDWLPIVAGFIYTNRILPFANNEYDLIQKSWTAIEKSLTFGAAPTYTPFLFDNGEFHPDLTVPFWADIFLQRGKKSGYACDYVFMRAWYQKEDIEQIIDAQNKLKKNAKANGEKYEATWDTAALQEVIDSLTTKSDRDKSPHERDRSINTEAIEIVTGFQRGVGASFFTFHPQSQTIVRTKKNKDPRGKMPIDWLYAETDGSNPLGRGIVELIGGIQNLMDTEMQMYQWNRGLALDPPMKKTGNFSSSSVVYEPGAVIDMGNDPNSSLTPFTVDTSALLKYPDLYGLQKSQLLNLVNSPDTSISADVGNPGFGKTPQALKTQQATISVDDNFIRKMFEAWFENWSETAINLYFAERSGTELLQLDDATALKLKKLAEDGRFDPSQLNDKNQILINYDSATPALKFRVDASSSKKQDDSAQQDALTGLFSALDSSPILSQLMQQYPEKLLEAWNKLVTVSGVEDPEDILVDIAAFKKQQEEAQSQQQEQETQVASQAQPPKMSVNYKDAPEDIKRQMEAMDGLQPSQMTSPVQQANDLKAQQLQQTQSTPQQSDVDAQLAQMLTSLGFSQDVIQGAINMADQGYDEQQILQAIGVGNG